MNCVLCSHLEWAPPMLLGGSPLSMSPAKLQALGSARLLLALYPHHLLHCYIDICCMEKEKLSWKMVCRKGNGE